MSAVALLGQLESVTGDNGQWQARCPSHDDNRASLSIASGDDGRVLLHCQAGCATADIVSNLNLEMRDLMPDSQDFQSNGHSRSNRKSTIAVTYDYCDADSTLIFQVLRMEPKGFRQRRPDGKGGWHWSVKDCPVVPYRLPQILASNGTVFVVEGEKDVQSLESIGLISTCNAGGASKWKPEHAKHLAGRDVVILPDNDEPGRKHAQQVAKSLVGIANAIKVVELLDLPLKGDVSNWIDDSHGDAATPEVIAEHLRRIVGEVEEWVDSTSDVAADSPESTRREPIGKFSLAELREKFPKLNEPIVDGLFRRGETVNIIASPKVGKSWLAYDLALSIIAGGDWLGQYATTQGKVLLVDNELHPSTLAHRVPKVAEAKALFPSDYQDDLDVWPLRGRLKSIADLELDFVDVESGEYQAIILDAKYRFATSGESENDNAAQAVFYNTIDRIAEQTQAAVVMIHHSSKGVQSGKSVTDVGAGAGAQSRAADCHLVLREHEDGGVFVLDGAVRSFAPVKPLALRWEFPLWTPAEDVDAKNLAGLKTRGEQRQSDKDRESMDAIRESLSEGAATARQLREKVGIGKDRLARLLDLMVSKGHIATAEVTVKGNKCKEYRIAKSGN